MSQQLRLAIRRPRLPRRPPQSLRSLVPPRRPTVKPLRSPLQRPPRQTPQRLSQSLPKRPQRIPLWRLRWPLRQLRTAPLVRRGRLRRQRRQSSHWKSPTPRVPTAFISRSGCTGGDGSSSAFLSSPCTTVLMMTRQWFAVCDLSRGTTRTRRSTCIIGAACMAMMRLAGTPQRVRRGATSTRTFGQHEKTCLAVTGAAVAA
mmetsp:Transcript_60272/g.168330  ORF Transcript_60272/g.168330 Transcript_60272/m.168330 type:complete len:202 (-) Transcript_60272:343-948(-)